MLWLNHLKTTWQTSKGKKKGDVEQPLQTEVLNSLGQFSWGGTKRKLRTQIYTIANEKVTGKKILYSFSCYRN